MSAEVVLTPLEPMPAGEIGIYLLQKGWDEATVTPQNFPLSGAYAWPAIRTAPISGTNVVRFDVTQEAIDWVSGKVPNDGLMLVDGTGWNPSQPGVIRSVGSSESAHQPYLELCYSTSPCSGKADYQSCNDATQCITGGFCLNGSCVGGQAAAAGTVCRPVPNGCTSIFCLPQASCKQAEVCDGVNAQCPPATIQPAGTVCRGTFDKCDVAATCDGASIECPNNAYLPSTHQCRPSMGTCDIAEYCTGSSAYCPPDTLEPSTYKCGPAGTKGCELDAFCTGTSPDCPPNVIKPAGGEPCYKGNDSFCSPSAYCDGQSSTCNIPYGQPDGTSCGSGTGQCEAGACQACGQVGQPCCTNGSPCLGSATCQGGACKAPAPPPPPPSCGHLNEACCPGAQCPGATTHPIACNPGNNLCVACGDNHQMCCFGTSGCNDPNYGCVAPGNPFELTCACETSNCPQGN
jgi:hypothetical protein